MKTLSRHPMILPTWALGELFNSIWLWQSECLDHLTLPSHFWVSKFELRIKHIEPKRYQMYAMHPEINEKYQYWNWLQCTPNLNPGCWNSFRHEHTHSNQISPTSQHINLKHQRSKWTRCFPWSTDLPMEKSSMKSCLLPYATLPPIVCGQDLKIHTLGPFNLKSRTFN